MGNKLKAPTTSKGDTVHAIAKVGLSSIPTVGGASAELFQLLVQPPLEKRRIMWMETVGEKLKKLEDHGFNLETLQDNERFISTVMHASEIALKTHQKEKKAALRNVILNAAKDQTPDEAVEHMFLSFIDSMSDMHMRILRLFQAPEPPPNFSTGSLNSVLEHKIPELKGRRAIYDQFWKDLYSRGLINTDNLYTILSENGLKQKRTTEIGDAFLHFIAEPVE